MFFLGIHFVCKIDFFIIYFYHLTLDNDESVSSNIRIKFHLKYMVLENYGSILLTIVLPKSMENTNGRYIIIIIINIITVIVIIIVIITVIIITIIVAEQ